MNTQISFFKIDNKFNRKTFFVNSVILFFIQLFAIIASTVLYFTLYKISIGWAIFSGILLLLPFVYFNFIICTKRIWDITNAKILSIVITTVLFLILGLCTYIIPFAFCIVYFLLLIIPENKNE